MVTPELIEYIRGEFAKGRKREEVHMELVESGGWGETDLNEAFRTVIPMQSSDLSNTTTQQNTIITPVIKDKIKSSKKILENLLFIVIGIVCVLFWYFYQPQIVSFWNSGVKSSQELSVNSLNFFVNGFKKIFNIGQKSDDSVVSQNKVTPQITKEIVSVKDCGTTNSPNLKNKGAYENDPVLNCLGDSAVRCIEAKAILKNALFPSVFEIIKNKYGNQDTCNFKLSYGSDSTLVDISNKKLALQYLMCPVNIVKAVDETKKTPVFSFPEIKINNLSKYASQIYFYGTIGVFMENNVDQNKIQALGCSGDYISSVVESYRKMQLQKK